MRTPALLSLLALAGLPAGAAPAATSGSPTSTVCGSALEALRELEDRVIAAPRDRVEAARRQMLQARRSAALACLGEAGEADGEAAARPPRIEAPPQLRIPPTLPAMRMPAPAAPARVAPPQPRTLGVCDANGCWASDGTRLQRVGPQLLGPSGFCTTAGHTVQCP